ncbi:hypothetical protein [Dyella choica]|uniref:Uncharacterized protein n=1 Tax=Dyella choica TaxID=1927959 RepID=A0A3S0RLP6_9GAMM|nr:hypothetical protein [Dyella choica]RUL77567.1 hypothetical protein EKH80_06720 [Dyella choica]
MSHVQTTSSLVAHARSIANLKFQNNSGSPNADKVCAVALDLSNLNNHYALFSGGPGFQELTSIVSNGSSPGAAKVTITSRLEAFLRSKAGGGFSDDQIKHKGYDPHGRGAMNCAEPKMYYLLRYQLNQSLRNWVLIPFNQNQSQILYNPPCKNCRRWVYQHFHYLSAWVARNQAGMSALVK